ncbi:MAG: putative undecaprenyl-phosphate N-acetylglucosaminyl 1-phosphate transferase [candidate division WS2 bacterium ADurb.Bin280]|uniref:Putative undecaprenyl-phosphate N-acetylglucosaminyl 1-phosphate transferase n=1 Tax=candidate division WS2 bacterium ADurb.Bin280 TaxID=1852829 RepID=A0A1V5SFV3_9BACT|nr:MAG: putative undecaprenyl-phosphate N-acetylglucosaminyl 1-phosphate transferase [candidate division WS2 bacterium ADurb.Bin280]
MLTFALIAFALSVASSFYLRKFSLEKKIALSVPRKRDVHQKPTPRLGGLAIIASTLITLLLLASFAGDQYRNFGFPFALGGISIDKRLLGIIIASIVLGAVMLRDDIRGVRPSYKLLSQILAALILIATGIGLTYLNNPFGPTIRLDQLAIPVEIADATYRIILFADLFFILWTVLLTNATNFIDGLDGLATTLSIIAGATICAISFSMNDYATATLALIWVGAMLGFLPFNLPFGKGGAMMFLGDTGSQFLGLMLSILTVISGGKLATVMLVFGIVILDALYVIAKRIARRQNPFTTADTTHLHHRFLKAGFSKTATLLIICAISASFGFSALIFEGQSKIVMIGALAILSLALFIGLDLKIKKTNN